MPHRILLVAVTALCAVLVAALPSARAGVLEDQLAMTRRKQRETRHELERIDHRTRVMSKVVAKYQRDLRRLDRPITELDWEIETLQSQIDTGRERIVHLRRLQREQARQIEQLEREVDVARDRLADRLVELYTSGEANYASWLIEARSIRDLIDREEMAGQIVALDRHVLGSVSDLQRTVRVKRAHNQQLRRQIARQLRRVRHAQVEVERKRQVLQEKRDHVARIKADRDAYLARLSSEHDDLEGDLSSLEQSSKDIAYAIEHGITPDIAGRVSGLSSSGLIWPVSGPVVSGFGMRWGRMHEGVDIAVGTGTPIAAAAAGVVTYASVMSGYGNMVLIQHGGNLVTGYAHQSQIATTVGSFVMQGQIIGYVGCTGHCFGPHLHFETRIGSTPHDPMGYL